METPFCHIIVYTPLTHADAVRTALADAGAGSIGNYTNCSFSSKGTGRFKGDAKSSPHIGAAETLEEVEEERIEVVVKQEDLQNVLQAVTEVHPYEEPAIHVLPMADYKDYL